MQTILVAIGVIILLIIAIVVSAMWFARRPRRQTLASVELLGVYPAQSWSQAQSGGERVEQTGNATGSDLPVGAFDDQYTAATADLSAGAVAEARAANEEGEASTVQAPIPAESYSDNDPIIRTTTVAVELESPPEQPGGMGTFEQMRPMLIGAGAAVFGVGAGAAFAYIRWRREQNRPINRLRRQLRSLQKQVPRQLPKEAPDMSEVADLLGTMMEERPAVPAGGAGALLLSLLVAAALRRRGAGPSADEQAAAVRQARKNIPNLPQDWRDRDAVAGFVTELLESGSRSLNATRDRVELQPPAVDRRVGIGTLAALALGGYLLWRMLSSRGGAEDSGWHALETSAPQYPNA